MKYTKFRHTTQPKTASWNWSGAGTGSSSTGYQVVPYTGSAYTIKVPLVHFMTKQILLITSFSATNAGTYSLLCQWKYLNPDFYFCN